MKIEVVSVDGYFLRQHFSPDFLYGRGSSIPTDYSPLFFAKANQFLIDSKFIDEADYFLWLEKQFRHTFGKSYQEKRQAINRKLRKNKFRFEDFIITTKKNDGLTIAEVDGAKIRRHLDCDAAWGWHDKVYSYCPNHTIAFETKADIRDQRPTIIHETIERTLMDIPQKLDYDQAHRYALIKEIDARKLDGASYPGDANFTLTVKQFLAKIKP